MPTRELALPLPLDLRRSWRPLRGSPRDPTLRLAPDEALRAWATPEGPVTLHVRVHRVEGAQDRVRAEAWGPGAQWALGSLPGLVGAEDDLEGWHPERHEVVARYDRRDRGLRMVRTGQVYEHLLVAILGQKVTGREAARGFDTLVGRLGTPAPGPGGMVLAPDAATLASAPDWEYRRAGVEKARAQRLRLACRRIAWLQASVDMTSADARARLTALRGIGAWTAASVERLSRGDADVVEVGDYHVPDIVAWNLASEARADDDRMLELLEPFRPHRGRAQLLIEYEGRGKPRRGPRMAPGTLSSPAFRRR